MDSPVNVSRSGGTFSWLPRLLVEAGGEGTLNDPP